MDGLTLPPSPMQALQAEHERLLGRLDDSGGVPCPGTTPLPIDTLSFETQALIHEARAYIERSKAESEWINDARDRSQLRANLRFWASFLLNCTGAYPDTTLRPPRPFITEYPGTPKATPAGFGTGEASVKPSVTAGGLIGQAPASPNLEEESDEEQAPFVAAESSQARPSWFSRLSRFFGLFAILIVGVIPLAAVCMALSLFYNLDNQSPWTTTGNPATQTAEAALLMPSPSPIPLETGEVSITPGPLLSLPGEELPLLLASISMGDPSPAGTSCDPTLILSLDAPKSVGGTPIPAVEVAVFRAGTEDAVARATLEPGAAPKQLRLEGNDPPPTGQDWLVQADHPWLGVEAVILSGALFENCAQNQVTIVYQAEPGSEVWQQTPDAMQPQDDLSLSWKLLTWGPEALSGRSWVAALGLKASGGNGTYVYYAKGDLAMPPTGSGMLPGDQVVLEQSLCFPAFAQVGVTSGGGSMSRALAVELVVPGCH